MGKGSKRRPSWKGVPYDQYRTNYDKVFGKMMEQVTGLDPKGLQVLEEPSLPKCQSCNAPGEELHSCPYSETIYNDSEPQCNCCESCTQCCNQEI